MTHVYACAEPVRLGMDELGEGPVWLEGSSEIGWVDIPAGIFHRYAVEFGTTTSVAFDQPVSAVVPRSNGGFAVAARDGVLLIDAEGTREHTVRIEADLPNNRLGDAAVDPAGSLWFGTLDTDLTHEQGTLYRLDGQRSVTAVLTQTSIANGLGWSPDGHSMYFIDSATRRVDRFGFDVDSGEITDREPWVVFADAEGVPDGLTVDENGGVWVALWRGGQVRRFAPDGTLSAIVPLPVRQVTSCAFGGPDLSRLYITTATADMNPRQRRAEPLAGALFCVETNERGLAQPRFAG